ncbi:MAG: Leader peptidase (Prepilin peptidase) (EC 3.4.23.43) / N-methyltransferase (EC 2.1.1.-) [Olavius algarvensis Gamma 3 endosymbiont]|nr:MAG: Leader peptidase (Prepilin peptidase) (EC 3.4.23.43) / N-methyltransferase (EC 2.1.1.-) [Olavius algarvensis Gamma 3 endosymbiont]
MFESFISLLEQQPVFYLVSLFVLGAVVGSFLNVVIYRLPVMMQREWRQDCLEFLERPAEGETDRFNLSRPRSRCAKCGHQITALENIPIVSYLALGGKCSSCRTSISAQYPLVELFSALVSVIVGWQLGVSLQTAAALLMTWSLIAASGIDIGHKLLPDSITLPLLWLGIFLSLFDVYIDLETSVIGAMAGYMSLWSIFILFKLVTGKEGMGHGDFKLLAMLGAWLGWKPLLVVILTSSVVGAVVGISMILMRRTERSTQIPFGPYLAAAGWMTLLWGDQLLQFYFSLFGI